MRADVCAIPNLYLQVDPGKVQLLGEGDSGDAPEAVNPALEAAIGMFVNVAGVGPGILRFYGPHKVRCGLDQQQVRICEILSRLSLRILRKTTTFCASFLQSAQVGLRIAISQFHIFQFQ
jgi:hypothetical protein